MHRMAKSNCACAASDAVVGITESQAASRPVSTWIGDRLGTKGLWLAGFKPTAREQDIEIEQLYI